MLSIHPCFLKSLRHPSQDGAILSISVWRAYSVNPPLAPASDLQQLAQAATFPAIRFLPLDRGFAVFLPHPPSNPHNLDL